MHNCHYEERFSIPTRVARNSPLAVFFLFIFSFLLCSCASDNYAPVSNFHAKFAHHESNALFFSSQPAKGYYIVHSGDTLYSVAFRHGMDYRVLARKNHLQSPYAVKVGQKLWIGRARHAPLSPEIAPGSSGGLQGTTDASNTFMVIHPEQTGENDTNVANNNNPQFIVDNALGSRQGAWRWPTEGKIVSRFAPANGQKGVNIVNQAGTPIFATAPGSVVYVGQGLEGYGKLIMIKHNSEYLSAYAHNAQVFVREGEHVNAGEKIATMGDTGTSRVMLHFEIRKAGRPIDPLRLLPHH